MRRPDVLFFDSNETMLDMSAMKPQVVEVLGGREELMSLWFSTMLYHSLVDTVTCSFHDFGSIGAACLQMIAAGHGIKLDKTKAKSTMAAMKTLPAHADVPIGLKKMQEAGIRMYPLTNSSMHVMESQIDHAGIGQYFEGKLSIEELNVYKPHPRTYHWAASKVGVPIGNCMLVAAHGWDVSGATIAGMRAAFVERAPNTLYPLGPPIELSGRNLIDIADQLVAMPA
jgi:2-haloacid dehalogenase